MNPTDLLHIPSIMPDVARMLDDAADRQLFAEVVAVAPEPDSPGTLDAYRVLVFRPGNAYRAYSVVRAVVADDGQSIFFASGIYGMTARRGMAEWIAEVTRIYADA